jgi:phage/plasmid primase-like uncharacterized protein
MWQLLRLQHRRQTMTSDVQDFLLKMKYSGLNPEIFAPLVDGKIHRFRDAGYDKPGKKNGWYVLHNIGSCISGAFGHWKTGLNENFSSKQFQTLTPAEQAAYKAKMETIRTQVAKEESNMRGECRAKAAKLWADAPLAKSDNHLYLMEKNVPAFGIKQTGDLLLIPLWDEDGTLHGLQKIGPNGEKCFMTGASVVGHYYFIGEPEGTILIAEGYATGATLHLITGHAVVCAFNAGNLKPVAEVMRRKYPEATIIVCADDDYSTKGNPGVTKATEAAQAINCLLAIPDFPPTRRPQDTDFNDLASLIGTEAVQGCISSAKQPHKEPANQSNCGTVTKTGSLWDAAKEFFPLVEFPWEVLPNSLAGSLKQLARSHATSAAALPGAAMAILSSVLGRTIEVSPKSSWVEPLIFWFGDIRPSGQGKTPAAQALCSVLYAAQERADDEYKTQFDEWAVLPKKEQGPPPVRARGYFATDLTLEGLRNDLSGHGGTICILDELSTFINCQNQYRGGKGADREAWLKLWDGKPARIMRAAGALYIRGSRVNIFGGIQPRVWREVFGGNKSLYIEDGTIYRFLPVFEGEQFHLLTDESWSEENKNVWENILTCAMQWADEYALQDGWEPLRLCFDDTARSFFIDWINSVSSYQREMPEQLRGFFPKLKTHVVRLAGLLHGMAAFDAGTPPDTYLSEQDVVLSVKCALFYMGHIVEALRHLLDAAAPASIQITEQGKLIAGVLRKISAQQDNGRLAIGYIADQFNKLFPERQIKARSMGAMLRALGLTIPDTRHNANGRQGVYCLEWNEKTDKLLNQSPEVQQVQRLNKDGVEMPLNVELLSPEVQQPFESEYPLLDFLNITKPSPEQANPCK